MNPPPFKVVFSRCGRYRYLNKHQLDSEQRKPIGTFILLNPSTVSSTYSGPTAAKTLAAARAAGMAQVFVVNLFAYCAPHPRSLRLVPDPVGPDNETWIRTACYAAAETGGVIVCAWGNGGEYCSMGQKVLQWLEKESLPAYAIAWTKHGYPQHPLRAAIGGPLLPFPAKGSRHERHRLPQGIADPTREGVDPVRQ